MSVIKMTAIGKSHAANAIRYALEKDRAQNPADRPVFLAANQVTLNDLTGKPTSPLEVWQDMEMKLATCGHDIDDPIWRIEFCPPPATLKTLLLTGKDTCLVSSLSSISPMERLWTPSSSRCSKRTCG